MSRYIVIGAGAVGAVVAAQLTLAGKQVVVVGRPGAHTAAIAERGLTVARPSGRESVRLTITSSAADVTLREGDVLVLAVKSQDAEAALDHWAWHGRERGPLAVLGADLPIVTLQNGLTTEYAALRRFRHVYGATIGIASSFLTPGEVASPSEPVVGAIWLGRFPRGEDETQEQIVADLTLARFAATSVPDIAAWKAWKLAINVANGLDLLDVTQGEREELQAALTSEAHAVLEAAGIDLARNAAPRLTFGEVPGYERRSSTWQSFARGASSEADWLNGEIVGLARLHGVDAPYNEALSRLLGTLGPAGPTPGAADLITLAGAVERRSLTLGALA